MNHSFILRIRQPDGSWVWDMDNPFSSRREAEKAAQINRIIGGILCQVWTETEAQEIINRAKSAEP